MQYLTLVNKVKLVLKEFRVILVQLDKKAAKVLKDSRVRLVNRVTLVILDNEVKLAQVVQLVR